MVGPSSSHTAGAVRIGLTARKLLGDRPVHADISLHGSFALTGHGHGIIGLRADRGPARYAAGRSAHSGQLCRRGGAGADVLVSGTCSCANAHPNTARLQLTGAKGRTLDIVAESIGGGRIRIRSIDGIETNFSGEHNTLIVHNQAHARPCCCRDGGAHAAARQHRHHAALYRSEQGGYAVMILGV
ncbi:MAG: serine dehydratase beta chain [Oscillospiraceae bacterium]